MASRRFLDHSQAGYKKSRLGRRVDPLVKLWVWQIREREHDCCGQRIAYFLEREHGVKLSVLKIEVLVEKYVPPLGFEPQLQVSHGDHEQHRFMEALFTRWVFGLCSVRLPGPP